jgi:hypothetical protein
MPHDTSRRRALLLLAFLSTPSLAATELPDDLVGFWTTEDAEYEGDELKKGACIYLSKSGRGAMIGGWIGFRIETTFNSATNILSFDAYDGEQKGPSGTMVFDPIRRVLLEESKPQKPWQRRASTIPKSLRVQLGIS